MTVRLREIQYFGWRPDTPDVRDWKFQVAKPLKVLPKTTDLRNEQPPVYDQGALGSCTAQAIAAALQFDRHKQRLEQNFVPSRLFIYYEERRIEGTIHEDAGAEIRDGIKVVASLGAPDEALWPYDISKFTMAPPQAVYLPALDTQAISYARVAQTLNDLKQTLAARFPVIFGFAVYESFVSGRVTRTGTVPMPKPTEYLLGGHAVELVGYDDGHHRFWCRNSWGTDWGNDGFFTMPYDYVLNDDLAADFWVIWSVG